VFRRNIEIIELLEELGFDGVWGSEHHFRDYGLLPSIPQMLSYIAGRTEKLRLGTGIIVLPLHNPVSIAEEIAQLDLISDGRVDFGIGRGYQAVEFEGHNISLTEARDRFNESLEIILNLWTHDEVAAFEGQHYSHGALRLMPKHIQDPHPPVYVAAVSPETVEMYAARGLPIIVDPATPFRKIAKAAEVWRTTATAAGHNVEETDLVASRLVWVATTNEKARQDQTRFDMEFDRSGIFNERSAPIDNKTNEIAKGFEYWQGRYLKGEKVDTDFRWDQQEIIGDPERVISQIQTVRDAGFNHLMCDFGSIRPMDLDETKQQIQFFAKEVMPAFR
jgi:alkanesulfonate monooxygenase SsuD/methylene tetrahydromethanopterin reductase-like flavin-dependent oxidoreductase (luciferase family)